MADLAGDAPAIIGSTAAGMATGGMGLLPALAAAGLVGAGSKGIGESVEALTGNNLQSAGEVATDLGAEGVASAFGEGTGRFLMGAAKRVMGPNAHKMTDAGRRALREAQEIGVKPNPSQVVQTPIAGRFEGVANQIFGNPQDVVNAPALQKEIYRLLDETGETAMGRQQIGRNIRRTLRVSRQRLSQTADVKYKEITAVLGDAPVVSTKALKAEAQAVLDAMPKTAATTSTARTKSRGFFSTKTVDKGGDPVFAQPATVKMLEDTLRLPDYVPFEQMQAARTFFREAAEQPATLTPGISKWRAGRLRSAANTSFDALSEKELIAAGVDPANAKAAIGKLRDTDKWYKGEVARYEDGLIKRLAKGTSTVEDEDIVGLFLAGKAKPSQVNRIMGFLPKKRQNIIRRYVMEDVLQKTLKLSKDPKIGHEFDAQGFAEALHSMPKDSMEALFPKKTVDDMFRLERTMRLVGSQENMSGGLVAASVALHPWRNMPKLVQIRLLHKLFNSEKGLKWLTIGTLRPNTPAGRAAMTRLERWSRDAGATAVRTGVQTGPVGDVHARQAALED